MGTMKAIIGAYPALSDDGQPPVQSITERVMAMPPMECVVRVYVIRVSRWLMQPLDAPVPC